jgi:hypothetical protein
MIISHKYRFIFLKTLKTAGTSVELSLCRYCGPEDIISALTEEDEAIRREWGGKPQHHDRPYKLTEFGRQGLRELWRTRRWPRHAVYWNHIPAKQIKRLIDPEIWNHYYKFCFVRNPWDRAISTYYWEIYHNKVDDFEAILTPKKLQENWNIYTIQNKIAVDFVGKFESLATDLQQVCDRIGLEWDGWLPKAKGQVRGDRRPYQAVLTPEQAAIVAQYAAPEIEQFGYRFPQ